MAQIPADAPEDFSAKVWEQMYEQLFKGPLALPTDREMMEGLAVRHIMPDGRQEPVTREMWFEKPSGWVWDRFTGADKKDFAGREIEWFGIDWAKDVFEIWEPKPLSDDDRAVHRGIVAMQRPTRANEL